jgi:hypothetical protein
MRQIVENDGTPHFWLLRFIFMPKSTPSKAALKSKIQVHYEKLKVTGILGAPGRETGADSGRR